MIGAVRPGGTVLVSPQNLDIGDRVVLEDWEKKSFDRPQNCADLPRTERTLQAVYSTFFWYVLPNRRFCRWVAATTVRIVRVGHVGLGCFDRQTSGAGACERCEAGRQRTAGLWDSKVFQICELELQLLRRHRPCRDCKIDVMIAESRGVCVVLAMHLYCSLMTGDS